MNKKTYKILKKIAYGVFFSLIIFYISFLVHSVRAWSIFYGSIVSDQYLKITSAPVGDRWIISASSPLTDSMQDILDDACWSDIVYYATDNEWLNHNGFEATGFNLDTTSLASYCRQDDTDYYFTLFTNNLPSWSTTTLDDVAGYILLHRIDDTHWTTGGASVFSINDPEDSAFIDVGSYTFSGYCENNGENQLFLGWRNYSIYESWYDIDCVDHNWSKSVEILEDVSYWYLVDKDESVEGMPVVMIYGVSDDPLSQYSLTITYPDDDGSHYFERQISTEAEFIFDYSLPYQELATSTRFEVLEYDGNDWSGTFNTLHNNTLEFYDIDLLGRFISEDYNCVGSGDTYYKATLYNSDDDVKYVLKFICKGVAILDAPFPDAPDLYDLGFWGNLYRNLFVPDRRFLKDYIEDIPDKLEQVVPFAYYYQLTDQITDVAVTSSATTTISFDVSVGGYDVEVPVFDTGLEPVQDFADGMRPFFSFGLWILLFIYIIYRLFDFEF